MRRSRDDGGLRTLQLLAKLTMIQDDFTSNGGFMKKRSAFCIVASVVLASVSGYCIGIAFDTKLQLAVTCGLLSIMFAIISDD